MPPKFNGQGRRDIKAENVEKKGNDGPPILPSKRSNPMKEERTGTQKPPSRVLTHTAASPSIPPPLLRSKIAKEVLNQPVSRLAYGLTRDKQKDKGELDGVTPVASLPPAPALDTQWVQLRRLQGRWIKGAHGDLLQADGIGSGVTEPFFFSAVRPGSSANKRASGWFGTTVNPLLDSKTVVDLSASTSKRRQSTVGDDKAPMASSQMMDPNATSTKSISTPGQRKKVKNPNPTNLKEYIAFLFGGNNPSTIYQGTPSVVKEFHAQCFPFVRADGFVEIATVASQVIAPMSPSTKDIIEIATHWLELESERDRTEVAHAANQREKEYFEEQQRMMNEENNSEGGGNNSRSPHSNNNQQQSANNETNSVVSSFPSVSRTNVDASCIAPPGFIQYAALLESVGKLLSDEHFIDLAYDLADVCSDGVVNKAAVKRAVASRHSGGKSEDDYLIAGQLQSQNEKDANNNNKDAAGNNNTNSLQGLPSNITNITNNNNNNNQAPASASSVTDYYYSDQNSSTSRTQTPAAGLNSTTSNLNNNTTKRSVTPHQQHNQNHQRTASRISAVTSVSQAQTTASSSNINSGSNNQQPQNFRSLSQLYTDLRAEREEYELIRAAEHPQKTQEDFVQDVIKTTTLGHEPRQRREPSPPGRYWVTKNPKVVEKLVSSKHFQFTVSSAVMRAFSHISNFEQHRAFFPKAKIGKKPKKNAQLPSMRQEHMKRSEFGDIFVSDTHVATPFLPYLLRCSMSELNPPPVSAVENDNEFQQTNQGARSPTTSQANYYRSGATSSLAS